MIDILIRAVIDAVRRQPQLVSTAVYGVNQFVKDQTGKSIPTHAINFVKSLWTRLTAWAKRYLAENATARKVYLSAVSIAAAVKRARNAGESLVRVKVFGQHLREQSPRVIHEEEVPLDQINGVIEQAKTAPVLAMRN